MFLHKILFDNNADFEYIFQNLVSLNLLLTYQMMAKIFSRLLHYICTSQRKIVGLRLKVLWNFYWHHAQLLVSVF